MAIATNKQTRNKRNNYGKGWRLAFADGTEVFVMAANRDDIKEMERSYGKLVAKSPL